MKRFSENFKNASKYIILSILLLIFGSFAINHTNRYLNDMIKRSLVEIAKQGAKTVENKIDYTFDKLGLASHLEVIKGRKNSIDEKLGLLKEINQPDDTYELAYINTDGYFYSVSGKIYDVKNEDFFIRAMSGEKVMEILDISYYEDYPAIAFLVPVYNGDNINGFVSSIYSAEMFCRLVDDITFSNEGYGYIIDSKGVTIAHTDRSLVMERVNSIEDAIDDSSLSQLAELEKRMLQGETDAGQYYFNGKKKIMGFTRIPNTNWSFAATSPVTDSFSNASPIIIFIAIIVCLLCLTLLLLNLYFAALSRKMKKEEQSLKNAVETGKIIIISFLEDGVILEFNKNAEEKLGYAQDEVIKILRIYDFLSYKEQTKLIKILETSAKGVLTENFEISLETSTGQTEHILFNMNIQDKDLGMPVYELMGICITDRVNYEIQLIEKHEELSAVYEELAASEEELKDQLDELIQQKHMLLEKDQKHSLVVDASSIGIWDWDVASDTYFYSDKWYEIYEIGKDLIYGAEKEYRFNVILDEDKAMAQKAYFKHLENQTEYYECEYRIKTPSGKIKWLHAVGKALFDNMGKPIKIAGANTDITAKKESEERIHKLAYFDSLTGLANRIQLTEKFNELINKDTRDIAIAIIDIDNFKLINDSYSHDIGDKLLIEVAKRLKDKATDKMFMSRIGGDDYALMLWDYESEEHLTEILESLIDHLEVTINIENYSINLTVNAGVAMYPKDANNFDDLLKNSDIAKYSANEQGTKYVSFDKYMNDIIVERLNLRNSLKVALENNEFVLFYQPQYRSSDRKIMGFETLIRWKNKLLGMVSPAKFIPAAEESGVIIPLGDWILEESIKFIKEIHRLGHNELIISVNISVVQLNQEGFAERVIELLEKYELPAEKLELEITESIMMDSLDTLIYNIDMIRQAGVHIALDDFGTGYSSLNYLTKIPINTLKIDKSFIDTIGHASERTLLLDSIMEIGHSLGLSIVAEGVETEEQYLYLKKIKCERIQGYYFCKPVPEDQILKLLKNETKD